MLFRSDERKSVFMGSCFVGANIAKVESRGKIYFHYAETKRIYERQLKPVHIRMYYAKCLKKKKPNVLAALSQLCRVFFLTLSLRHPN